jgi:anti-sigma factor RsiW
MSEIKCERVRSVLPAYLDGELARPEAEAVRRHLQHCESCQAQARLLDDTWEALDEAQAATKKRVPGDFTERLMERLQAEKQREAAEARRRPWRIAGQVVATLAGMAAGLLIGLTVYGYTSRPPEEPVNPVEQEVKGNVTFLEDSPYVDEMTLLEAMDRVAAEQPSEKGA